MRFLRQLFYNGQTEEEMANHMHNSGSVNRMVHNRR